MTAAAQMLCGGAGELLVGLLLGEPFRTDWSAVTGRSLLALAYLIAIGSWVGYTAYVWLLKNTSPAKISTYAYVNPVIAVVLGAVVLREPVNLGMLWAAGVILLGVFIITLPASTVVPFAMGKARGVARRLGLL